MEADSKLQKKNKVLIFNGNKKDYKNVFYRGKSKHANVEIYKYLGIIFHKSNRFTKARNMLHIQAGAGPSSDVERSLGAMGRRIDPSWLSHWAISRSSQCSTTGVTKAVVCVILSVGMVRIKEPLLLIDKSSLCGGSGFPFSLSEWALTICLTPYNRR